MALALMAAAMASSSMRYECAVEGAYVATKMDGNWSVEPMAITNAPKGSERFSLIHDEAAGKTTIIWPDGFLGISGEVQGAWTDGKFVFVADGTFCSFRQMACVAMGELAVTSATQAQFSITVATKAAQTEGGPVSLFQPMAFGSCNKAS